MRQCSMLATIIVFLQIGRGSDKGDHRYQPLDCVIVLALLARQRQRAGLWTSYYVVNCIIPVSSISDDLFSGMCRDNGKQESGVGV